MSDSTVIVGRQKQPDAVLSESMDVLWNSARLFFRAGGGCSFPWQELQRKIQPGETLVIQNLDAVLYSGPRPALLYTVYRRLEALLDNGHFVVFAEENIQLRDTSDGAWQMLAALAQSEQNHNAEVGLRRVGASTADQQTLKRVQESLQRYGGRNVKKVCEENGISRTTFYAWRRKGLILHGDPDDEASRARRGRSGPTQERLAKVYEAIKAANGNVSNACRAAGEHRPTVYRWINQGLFKAAGLDMEKW